MTEIVNYDEMAHADLLRYVESLKLKDSAAAAVAREAHALLASTAFPRNDCVSSNSRHSSSGDGRGVPQQPQLSPQGAVASGFQVGRGGAAGSNSAQLTAEAFCMYMDQLSRGSNNKKIYQSEDCLVCALAEYLTNFQPLKPKIEKRVFFSPTFHS